MDGPVEVGSTVWVTVTVGTGSADGGGVETSGEGVGELVAVGCKFVSDGEGDVAGEEGETCKK